MIQDTKKTVFKQRKTTRNQQITTAQMAWKEEAKKLVQEKTDIGYQDFSVEAFLQLTPEDLQVNIEIQSQILDLQARYKNMLERKNDLWLEDNIVAELNKIHAVIHIDRTYILTEKLNTLGEPDFSAESKTSFLDFYEDDRVICPFDNKERSKAEIWLKSPKRRKFKGIVFDPKIIGHSKDHFNIWKGFTKKAIQGDCSKYSTHMKDNICDGDEESYIYLRKWLSYVFQHPDRVHTAIVLQGFQGVGKNSFVRTSTIDSMI